MGARSERWPAEGPWWIDDFLAPETCRLILDELEFSFWQPSRVVRRPGHGGLATRQSLKRLSESSDESWFSPELARELRRIEGRLTRLLGCPRERFERWQATRYAPGGRFDFHFDCGFFADEPAGEREITVLLYLDSPKQGGSTRFRELGLEVEARAGRLLAWRNLLPGGPCDPRSLHASAPVRKGRKTTLVTWIRQRALRT
jgi:prolyl 4-hydroxylase